MVFVHARNAAVKTALTLREMANNHGDSGLFQAKQSPVYGAAEKQVNYSSIDSFTHHEHRFLLQTHFTNFQNKL